MMTDQDLYNGAIFRIVQRGFGRGFSSQGPAANDWYCTDVLRSVYREHFRDTEPGWQQRRDDFVDRGLRYVASHSFAIIWNARHPESPVTNP